MDNQATRLRVLIVDDHKMVRDGLRIMLESDVHRFEFAITEAESGEEAIKLVLKKDFDLVIIDFQLPGINGAQAIRDIAIYRPAIKILALSNYDEYSYIKEVMSSGAHGYVLKNIEPDQLSRAIETILAGRSFYSNEVALRLLDAEEQKNQPDQIEKYGVTKRELEILKLVVKGLTNDEIANKLYISKRTVDTHRQNLLAKLRVKNTAGLIKLAYDLKVVDK